MQLYYTDSGKGAPALVFLHYFGGASSSWEDVISSLGEHYRCIAVDLFGFGKSPAPQSLLSVEESSEKVMALIESLSLTNYILIGHSMGAKIVVDIASRPVKNLRSVILIAPSPPSPEPMKDEDRQDMIEAFGKKEAVEKMIQNALGSNVSNTIFEREVNNNLSASEMAWKSWAEHGSLEDISLRMQYISVPVHIIYGENDNRFTKKFLEKEYGKYFKTFTLTEVKDAGHLVPIEAPQKVAELIGNLLG